MRLRTLPLSLAGVITGIALALGGPGVRTLPVVLLLLTTVLLQILTNLSNELGDTLHGTDTDVRQGIRYSLQDGLMTVRQMKILIAVFAGLSCLAGLAMIRAAF
ncbi:MAG: 1,4-dihydroxy-2-naphthoate octaprenyltransferase, partial [Bacteroidales bacterium]|nr:1,4-dihydroxy-2-naphthoate octaprenyltransferase [Bacteroidales bacterium]